MKPDHLDCEPIPGQKPTIIYQDEDLIVVDKPQGWLTHDDGSFTRPSVTAWLDIPVGVHHRLDVDTTGVLAFSKSPNGNQILRLAFGERRAVKRYEAVLASKPQASRGEINTSVPGAREKSAHTRYEIKGSTPFGSIVHAWPTTGRRHQIRAHMASIGCPILGDSRYGDPIDRQARRTLLHCAEIKIDGQFHWQANRPADLDLAMGHGYESGRRGLSSDEDTSCYRLINGEADGFPGWSVDIYGDWAWVQDASDGRMGPLPDCKGIYQLQANPDRSRGQQSTPFLLQGQAAPDSLVVSEHGTAFQVGLGTQLSTGLFLDQRPQRAWLAQHAGGMRVLNTFAHAGGYSIAAARAGAQTVSLDLSRSWLERIEPQLVLNGLKTEGHDWIYGDVFSWLPRLAKRGERFDLVILDPPSTSVGRAKKRWSAAQHYPELVEIASKLVAPGGLLWTVTNHSKILPRRFSKMVKKGLPDGVRLDRVCPPAVDFPCTGPAPVKTLVWRFADTVT